MPADSLDMAAIVAQLRSVRERWRDAQRRPREPGGRELPSREALDGIVQGLRGALFPMRLGPADLRQENEDAYVGRTLDEALNALRGQVTLELRHEARLAGEATPAAEIASAASPASPASPESRSRTLVQAFAASLATIRELLDSDVVAAYDGDPAARSVDEVLLCYPGIEAMIHHRLAHRLHELGVPLIARMLAERAHGLTGIDIHPGARIGRSFFIDHGTGVVIGETAVIGERVRIYQAVTLGARRFPTDRDGRLEKGLARHPVVEDDVVIYAGATVLGRVTLGRGASIGGNVWLTRSVPPGSQVTQASLLEQGEPR